MDEHALDDRHAESRRRIAALEAELARVKDALRTIRKATYICTVSLQDWRHCVLEVQRVADAAMKD